MEERTMTKRAKKTSRKKNTPALVKASTGLTLPAVAKAAKAIPVPAILLVVGACAVGALAVFLFSGPAGQRRRELIRDKALAAGHDVSEMISKGSREVRQRVESVASDATKRLRSERSEAMPNGQALHG
jgi:hypothetical protein